MIATEIISIGNELLNGRVLNRNAAFLARELEQVGYRVRWITTLADNIDDIVAGLASAWQRAQLIIITGGIGPTHDDVTCEAVCRFFATSKVFQEQAWQALVQRYAAREIAMPPGNEKQAYIPGNCSLLPNRHGTAVGFHCHQEQRRLFVLPGVPHEMELMFTEEVLARIVAQAPCPLASRRIRTTGLPESAVYQRLDALTWLPEQVEVAFLASTAGVDIDVKSKQSVAAERVAKRIGSSLAPWVYSRGEDLEQVVAHYLSGAGYTLAVAESCSGGLVADRLTNVPGSSAFFKMGIVAYSNQAKVEMLGVATATLNRFGAVSAECAGEMAAGVRRRLDCDFGIATTGIAGPGGGTSLKPVGLIYIAWADRRRSLVQRYVFKDLRILHKQRSAQAALALLWQQIRKD